MSSPSLSPENYAMLRRTQRNYVLRDLGPGLTMDYLWFNLNRGVNSTGETVRRSGKARHSLKNRNSAGPFPMPSTGMG